jgi:thiol:disulfide interchange protein DsbC
LAADANLEARFNERLHGVLPDVEVTDVREGPVAGLYEVELGADILYMSADGRYVVRGDVYDLDERVNITDQRRSAARAAVFKALAPGQTVDFVPANAKHTLFVYTDVDCTYCRRLHSEIQELMAGGIGVRYLAFPRAGLNSDGYRKSVNVWCANDPRQAMTQAKSGQTVADAECDNPVADQFELGKQMGVRGTPAVYSEDGQELGGYIPAGELIRMFQGQG